MYIRVFQCATSICPPDRLQSIGLSIVVGSPEVKHKIGFNPAIPSVFLGNPISDRSSMKTVSED